MPGSSLDVGSVVTPVSHSCTGAMLEAVSGVEREKFTVLVAADSDTGSSNQNFSLLPPLLPSASIDCGALLSISIRTVSAVPLPTTSLGVIRNCTLSTSWFDRFVAEFQIRVPL